MEKGGFAASPPTRQTVMTFDAILSPPEIDLLPRTDLSQTVCVVFDILRATTSIVTGLAHGVEAIRPASTIEEALALREQWPTSLLGGERHGEKIDGFDLGNSPLEYCAPDIREVITTTTNGTLALRACEEAGEILVGALINAGAVIERLRARQPKHVALVCSGTGRSSALEDVLAAGLVVSAFPEAAWTDAAKAAAATYERYKGDLLGALQESGNGTKLMRRGRTEDVAWCAQVSQYAVVGIMKEGVIRRE